MAELKNLQKLQRLFNLMDDDALTKEQFKSAFTRIGQVIQQNEDARNKAIARLGEMVQQLKAELKDQTAKNADATLKKLEADLSAIKAELAQDRATIAAKLAEVKDGDDADEEYVIEQATQNILPVVTEHATEMEVEMNKLGEQIAAIDEFVRDVEKKIEDLKKRPTGTGTGVTNMRIQQAFKTILKTEQPVGDIDGANTSYTVSQPIFAVFAFSLNGEVIAQLPNYTINGNTITFSEALPAAYSGKDFEVKYI